MRLSLADVKGARKAAQDDVGKSAGIFSIFPLVN